MQDSKSTDLRNRRRAAELSPNTVAKIDSIIDQQARVTSALEQIVSQTQGSVAKRLLATCNRLQAATVAEDVIDDADTLAVCWHVIEAGQSVKELESEQLADAIRRSATMFRNQADSKLRLGASLAYPYTLLVIAFAMCVLASYYIVEDINLMYREFAIDLPEVTRILFGLAESIRRWWIIGAVLLGLLGFWLFASATITPTLPYWIRILMIRNLGLRQAWSRWAWHTGWLLKLGVCPSEAVLIAGNRSEEKWLRENSLRWSEQISENQWFFPSRPRAHWEPYGLLAHAFTLPMADDQASVLHAYTMINRERSFARYLWWLSWAPPVMMLMVVIMIGLFVVAVYAPMLDLFWWGF